MSSELKFSFAVEGKRVVRAPVYGEVVLPRRSIAYAPEGDALHMVGILVHDAEQFLVALLPGLESLLGPSVSVGDCVG